MNRVSFQRLDCLRWIAVLLCSLSVHCSKPEACTPDLICSCPDGSLRQRRCGLDPAQCPCTIDWKASETPKTVQASGPGYLQLRFQAIELLPGETSQLAVDVYDTAGAAHPPPAPPTWRSSDASVLVVDAAGALTAKEIGTAEVTALTEGYGDASLVLSVVRQKRSGPAIVHFEHAFLALGVGQSRELSVEIRDSSGDAVATPSDLMVEADRPEAVTINGSKLTGNTQALSTLRARLAGGGALAGQALVSVRRPTPDANMCGETSVVGCSFDVPTVSFSKPGLSRLTRVFVERRDFVKVDGSNTCAPLYRIDLEAPDRVEVTFPEVATIGTGGLLEARAPGSTYIRGFFGDVDCGMVGVSVDVDLSGHWSAECSNGDQGTVNFRTWPELVWARSCYAGCAGSTDLPVVVAGRSTFCNTQEEFSCLGDARSSVAERGPGYPPGRGGCSPNSPCPAAVSECAVSRHVIDNPGALPGSGSGFAVSADLLYQGICTFRRGLGETVACPLARQNVCFRGSAVEAAPAKWAQACSDVDPSKASFLSCLEENRELNLPPPVLENGTDPHEQCLQFHNNSGEGRSLGPITGCDGEFGNLTCWCCP